MKTIGLLGGMSWESTIPYYRLINEAVRQRLGGLHSAKLLLHSVDFAQIEACQRAGDWDAAGARLTQAARGLQMAGAELLLIGANTMHKVAPAIEAAIDIPLLHVADATAPTVSPVTAEADIAVKMASIGCVVCPRSWATGSIRSREPSATTSRKPPTKTLACPWIVGAAPWSGSSGIGITCVASRRLRMTRLPGRRT